VSGTCVISVVLFIQINIINYKSTFFFLTSISSSSSISISLRSISSTISNFPSLPSHGSLSTIVGNFPSVTPLNGTSGLVKRPVDNSFKNALIPVSLNAPFNTTYFPLRALSATCAG